MLTEIINAISDYQNVLHAHQTSAALLGLGITGLTYFTMKGDTATNFDQKYKSYLRLHKIVASALLPAAAGLFTVTGAYLAYKSGYSIDQGWYLWMVFLAALGK
jgi:uncharacterized membrane protein